MKRVCLLFLLTLSILFSCKNAPDSVSDKAGPDFKAGNTKFQNKDYSGALDDYNKVLAIDSDYATVWYNRGVCKSILGNPFEAIQDFNRCIAIDSTHYIAYYNRANAKYDLHDYLGAIDDFTHAIALRPADADIYYNRALAHLHLDQSTAACRDFSKAGELGSRDAYEAIDDFCNKVTPADDDTSE